MSSVCRGRVPGENQDALKEAITKYWNLRSDSYGDVWGPEGVDPQEGDAWREELRGLLPPPPLHVLDVGAGTGFLSILMAQLGHRVTATDLAEEMLRVARDAGQRLGLSIVFAKGDAHQPDFPDGSFDLVANRHLLWTLREPEEAFANWYRVLRPGGLLVAIDSLWFVDKGRMSHGLPPHCAQAWQELYSDDVRARLPIMNMDSLEPVLGMLSSAGFEEVSLGRMLSVEAFYRERNLEGDRDVPRYVVVARRPDRS